MKSLKNTFFAITLLLAVTPAFAVKVTLEDGTELPLAGAVNATAASTDQAVAVPATSRLAWLRMPQVSMPAWVRMPSMPAMPAWAVNAFNRARTATANGVEATTNFVQAHQTATRVTGATAGALVLGYGAYRYATRPAETLAVAPASEVMEAVLDEAEVVVVDADEVTRMTAADVISLDDNRCVMISDAVRAEYTEAESNAAPAVVQTEEEALEARLAEVQERMNARGADYVQASVEKATIRRQLKELRKGTKTKSVAKTAKRSGCANGRCRK